MNPQESTQVVIDGIKSKMPFILAGIIILSAIADAVSMAMYGADDAVFRVLAILVRVVMGFFIVLDPMRNLMRSVGFYALSLGLARILESFGMLANPSDLFFAIAIVMIGMGVNQVYSGYNYLRDVSRGRFGMIFGSAALALLMVIIIVSTASAEESLDPDYDAQLILSSVIYLAQYVLILLIMDGDDFRFSSWNEKSVRKLDEIRLAYTLTPGMRFPRPYAVVLKHMFDDRSSWSPVDDGGPVECETRLRIVDDKATSVAILQKWKGSDRIYMTVTPDDVGTILQANRFWVTDVVADDKDDGKFTNLRLYADGTMISNVSVAPDGTEVAQ